MSQILKSDLNRVVGLQIKRLRTKKSLGQKTVASRLGISNSAYSRIESGFTDINLSRLEQLSAILETDIIHLLDPHFETKRKLAARYNVLKVEVEKCDAAILSLKKKCDELRRELKTSTPDPGQNPKV